MPLLVRDAAVGTLNLYTHRPDAFDEEAARVAAVFAGPAGVVLANAQALELGRRLTGQLREAMASRAVIEQAKGFLMAQLGLSADEAFGRLRHLSQVEHRKLRDVAQQVLAGATSPGRPVTPADAPGRPPR